MNDEEKELQIISLREINGSFMVEDYQRGYRWQTLDVERLLNDIYESGENKYFLQPIVLKKLENGYELIDGQQRLTSIYLIYQALNNISLKYEGPKFNIEYRTRGETKISLNNINPNSKDSSIDNYYIFNARETIGTWISEHNNDLDNFYKYLNSTQIIKYIADKNEKSEELFNRLNIGRIPLTSSELVKATFLGNKENTDEMINLQTEIAMQWDEIEKELHIDEFWSFLTNESNFDDKPRIDLVLDLISHKSKYKKYTDNFYTFFEIDKKRKNGTLKDTWDEILKAFYTLKGWYEDRDCFHKVGYLIASESESLLNIYEQSTKNTNKNDFKKQLDIMIIKSIKLKDNKEIASLDYNVPGDYDYLNKLLLLFNIESVRRHESDAERFSFYKFKYKEVLDEEAGQIKKLHNKWTLEHIHAQNSEGLNDRNAQYEWLKEHLKTVEMIDENDTILINEINSTLDNAKFSQDDFYKLFDRIIYKITNGNRDHVSYLDSIANLALLNHEDNSALNKSTFDVKRRKIKELEKMGKYIPYCTKMVFLKYYNDNSDNHLYYWGVDDMKNYIAKINETLNIYLDGKKIELFSEDDK